VHAERAHAIFLDVGGPSRTAHALIRRTAAVGFLLLAVQAAGGCGGQSLTGADDDAVGGAPDGGTSGAGSTSGGGGAAGGTSGTGTAGTNVAGTSSGGAITGGTGGGSTGGGPGICTLPIDPGRCEAYVPSFGFSAADGNCQRFIYGGCEGNANRFETLAECEAQCGGTLSRCPTTVPSTAALGGCAIGAALVCTYDAAGCLCAVTSSQACNKIEPDCGTILEVPPGGGVPPPDGDRIVCRPYTLCTCGPVTSDAPATWVCQPGCGAAL
jgi:hypothetical protein